MPGSVTISASYGANGDRIGHAVAERLDLPFLDRAIPATVARQLKLSEDAAETLDQRAPSRWDRIAASFTGIDASYSGVPFLATQGESADTFRAATESVLRQVADTTGAVILGRAAMVVLGDRRDVLKVRLDGPVEARIAQAVANGADEEVAIATQRDVDAARQHYAKYFYNVSQDDVSLYHLFIDTTALPVAVCVELISAAAEARFATKKAV
jgi:cytidylate kinase